MAVLGLRFCARAFSSCGKWGPIFIAVRGPLIIAASLVAEHRLQMRRLSNCGSRAQSLRGMWDPPRPGLEPVSPALAGRLPTTAPPGKPQTGWFLNNRNVFLTVLEAESPRSRCWQIQWACFLVHRRHFLTVSSHRGRDQGSLWGLFYKGSNLHYEGAALMT